MSGTGDRYFSYPPARHHKLIIENLERFERGEIKRLMILAPPGSAKSTYCSIQYPLYRLARNPRTRILCVSNTQSRAEDFNRARRTLALSSEWQRLSQTRLADGLQGVELFGTAQGGRVYAAGIGSTITSIRSDVNVLDDPISGFEEALSPTALDKQWEWYFSDLRTRLEVAGGLRQELVVSTRWARRDIAGRLLELEGNKWTVIRLPCLADSADDPLGREEGENLWPLAFTPDVIEEVQRDPLRWSTLYQQTPLDKAGSWIGSEYIHYTDARPVGEPHVVIAVDLALTVGRGDYTVFVVAQIDSARRIHIIHVDRRRVSPDQSVDRLFELAWIFQPMEVLIDDDNASKVFKTLLHERLNTPTPGQRPFALHPMPMRGKDKETRATAIRGEFMRNNVRILRGDWNAALLKELLEFPSSDHDDQIDALSLVGRRLPVLSAPKGANVSRDPYQGARMRPDGEGGYVLQAPLNEMFSDRERYLRSTRGRI